MIYLQTAEDYAAFWEGQHEREERHTLMEVSCQLWTPVICDAVGGLHLDGPLSYAVYMDMSREEREALPPMDSMPWVADFVLPLSTFRVHQDARCDDRLRAPDGRIWWWACSDNLTPWQDLVRTPVRGPTAVREMIRMASDNRVNISSGEFKPVNHTYGARWPQGGVLTWLAYGDADEVRRLLTTHIEYLGKRHNTGHGQIRPGSWSVTPIKGSWDEYTEDGRRIRRSPAGHGPEAVRARLGTIRAPYHHRSRLVPSIGPG